MICFWFSDTEWSKSIFTWKEYVKNWKSERMASIIDDIMHILCIWLASLEASKTRNELWTHLKLYFPIKSSRAVQFKNIYNYLCGEMWFFTRCRVIFYIFFLFIMSLLPDICTTALLVAIVSLVAMALLLEGIFVISDSGTRHLLNASDIFFFYWSAII